MKRGGQIALGVVVALLGAAFILVPMIALGEKPGTWLIWTGGGAIVVGLSVAVPVEMKQVAKMVRKTVPFLGEKEEG